MTVVDIKQKVSKIYAENDFEKLKKAFKTMSIIDVKPIVLASINTMKNIGEFTEAIGKLEKKNPESYDTIAELSERPETVMMSFIDKVPDEKLKPLISLTLELATIQNDLNNIKSLSADKKIELGRALKMVAIKITKLIGEIK